MSSRYRNNRKRRTGETFTMLLHSIFKPKGNKPAPVSILSKSAELLLIHLSHQYTVSNNGDICAAPKTLEPYGYASPGAIREPLIELLAKGFLQQTRQGGKNKPSLYAVTWWPIDASNKLDFNFGSKPLKLWENPEEIDRRWIKEWEKICAKRQKKGSKNA